MELTNPMITVGPFATIVKKTAQIELFHVDHERELKTQQVHSNL